MSSERLSLPTGMRAVITSYGDDQNDAITNHLKLEPQPPPLLSEVEDGDIVVAVRATEVVWTDTVMATGQYQHQAKTPYSPGMTYSGVVAYSSPKAVSAGVIVGQRVAIAGSGAGPRSLDMRYQRWGGAANYAVAPCTAVRNVPEHWTFEEAACFAYGYDTAHYVLVECADLKAGDTILIHGATGGVGIPAVRIAKALGATVIASSRSK